jgi:hypothetical protein
MTITELDIDFVAEILEADREAAEEFEARCADERDPWALPLFGGAR